MENFLYDAHGLTWEGAFLATIITVAGIYLTGFLVLRGIKCIKRNLLEMLRGGKVR